MDYDFRNIEKKWREFWAENKTFAAKDISDKPKYYVLDMFPYPSGAGLHVGHPLGYIASDIYARYKRMKGFNVLHPMGYDSFGLPAEQYAIQTGQHPRVTTKTNIEGGIDKSGDRISGYRKQLDILGFSFDWDREVRTSSPEYYKWTQWIFKQLFDCYYDNDTNKAQRVSELIEKFKNEGNLKVNAAHNCEVSFSAKEWNQKNIVEQNEILMSYRLTYLADSWVNWCPELGTVLANDEVVNGLSERGGYAVEQKLMRQWSMRIKAYAERLLNGLEKIDWSDSIKDQQRNWIGKSEGASVLFEIEGSDKKIEVFTTRPDTIFGVSFMVLAPEHNLVEEITTSENESMIKEYKQSASLKSERERQAEIKNITGQFTGAYAIHPFNGNRIPIWIGDYVLASYGTGAVMSVPCGDQRDWNFATHFGIDIVNIFKDKDISEGAYEEKDAIIANSDFLNDLSVSESISLAIKKIEELKIGKGKINYRLRDAVFSRQRYWGEPFPVYYRDELPYLVDDVHLPITLPEIDKYVPTKDGDPPLARADQSSWNYFEGDRMEHNTMPGWAGSSWYFLRFMDPKNENEFVGKDKVDYWNNVDLYIGGSEHATGHLLYSRFWTKVLYDLGYLPFEEPFEKMINQGMILGRSSFVYRIKDTNKFVTSSRKDEFNVDPIHVDISMVEGDKLDVLKFKAWRPEYENAAFIFEQDGTYLCGHEIEKMSKSKYNVQTPDELVEKYGADTLRMYEMFLGPLEQSKPWDTKGINGVHNFLRKLWRLFHDSENNVSLDNGDASIEALKTLHKTIKKVSDDLERFSFNTVVSNLMICVNELGNQKCRNKMILRELVILLSPYAPHIAEELWVKLDNQPGTLSYATFPVFNEEYLIETNHSYPVSFNGKMHFKMDLPTALSPKEVELEVLSSELAKKWLEGKTPKKVIVVPGKIVNIVV